MSGLEVALEQAAPIPLAAVFACAPGEVMALVGPSGSGKTTILRAIAGSYRPKEGRVTVNGETWLDTERRTHMPPWERAVGWVPQEAMLFPHRSVRANLDYAGRAGAQEIREIASWLGIEGLLERRPRRLSGGERQRVALGRALLAKPRLLLLDEPFAALDRSLRSRVAGELADRCERAGLPLVLVSHDETDVHVIAEQTWELREGGLSRLGRGTLRAKETSSPHTGGSPWTSWS
ncbi:MAG: ATP-binding cassette domain-containing protein [Polyangiales bacterium]